jgi:hypothetical protein
VPDKSVPWFQGTLVINERNTPNCPKDQDGSPLLETWLSGELDGQGDSDNQAGQESWDFESMFFMVSMMINGPWYQGQSRPRS